MPATTKNTEMPIETQTRDETDVEQHNNETRQCTTTPCSAQDHSLAALDVARIVDKTISEATKPANDEDEGATQATINRQRIGSALFAASTEYNPGKHINQSAFLAKAKTDGPLRQNRYAATSAHRRSRRRKLHIRTPMRQHPKTIRRSTTCV